MVCSLNKQNIILEPSPMFKSLKCNFLKWPIRVDWFSIFKETNEYEPLFDQNLWSKATDIILQSVPNLTRMGSDSENLELRIE